MEAEMKTVFQQKVQEKEQKLKQSEEELYARHREMKEALEKQRLELEDKKRRVESGRPLTPEKGSVIDLSLLPGEKEYWLIRRSNRKSDLVWASRAQCQLFLSLSRINAFNIGISQWFVYPAHLSRPLHVYSFFDDTSACGYSLPLPPSNPCYRSDSGYIECT